MSIAARYQIRHQTVYAYAGDVAHAHHMLHLTPPATPTQRCSDYVLELWPRPALCRRHADAFGNMVTSLEIDRPHSRLEVTARMQVELLERPARLAAETLSWEQVAATLRYSPAPVEPDRLNAMRYRTQSPFVPLKRVLVQFALECFAPGTPVLAGAEALMHKIHREFTYAPGDTHISTPLLEVLDKRRGVCQDYAHLMIACLRSIGLAARYVSGYLRTVSLENAAALVGADASHAWVGVWAPPFGWVELDPTNNVAVGKDHVVLAWGRDFGDVSPLRGVILGGGAHSLEVGVAVRPLKI
jgi:transglutaminase-like putative cysteine protease